MKKVVICVPLEKGVSVSKETWGLIGEAQKIARNHSLPLVGMVVHAGLCLEEISLLPFDEIYHSYLEPTQWLIAAAQIDVIDQMLESINFTDGAFLFVSKPLYHEIAIRLALHHKAALVTNVTEILLEESTDIQTTLKRGLYNDRASETISLSHNQINFFSFNKSHMKSERQQTKPEMVQEINCIAAPSGLIRFKCERELSWQELALPEAKCVIGVGRGVWGSENLDDVYALAALLNAPVGGSKVADELGLITPDRRIGASGITIDGADVYVAIGISGSSQHLEGIKQVKHVIAINTDPAAGIFARSDIGIIGDYKKVLPELINALMRERRDA